MGSQHFSNHTTAPSAIKKQLYQESLRTCGKECSNVFHERQINLIWISMTSIVFSSTANILNWNSWAWPLFRYGAKNPKQILSQSSTSLWSKECFISGYRPRSCRHLTEPLFRVSSRFESLILSHHLRFNVTCEGNKGKIDDDDDGLASAGARHEGFAINYLLDGNRQLFTGNMQLVCVPD